MSLFSKVHYFGRSAGYGLRHSPFVHLVAVFTIAIALFTAGLSRGAVRVLDSLLDSLGGEVELTVYLSEQVRPDEVDPLRLQVENLAGGKARYVAPDQALERLSRELGELGGSLAQLRRNPLPATLELEVPALLRTPEGLAALAARVLALPQVSGVDYGAEAVSRLSAIADALRYGGLVALSVVVLATIVIISATLQLAIYARRDEIEIQKLVGATDTFVKAPFLLEGLFQGVLGASGALLGLWLFSRFAGPGLGQLFSFLLGPGQTELQFVNARGAAELLVGGCALGLCGSFVAVGRFLRV